MIKRFPGHPPDVSGLRVRAPKPDAKLGKESNVPLTEKRLETLTKESGNRLLILEAQNFLKIRSVVTKLGAETFFKRHKKLCEKALITDIVETKSFLDFVKGKLSK